MTGMMIVNIGIRIILFSLLAVGMYLLIKAVHAVKPVKTVLLKLDEMEKDRTLETGEKKNGFTRYLDRMDEQLTQAGIKRWMPKATVELYFLFNVLEFTLIFCLAGEGILLPLLTAAIAVYLNKLLIDIMRYRNKRIVEKHLLEVLNLISDYSITESEITLILYKSGANLPNPLREVLMQCHINARNTGNVSQALYELRRSVDHFLFQEIILLLELCSKSDSNYQKVVNGCREMVNRYLKEEKEKVSVVRGLIGEAALMTGVAIYGISTMLREFAGDVGFGNTMSDFFFYNSGGRICLLIYAALLFAMIQVILKFAKR